MLTMRCTKCGVVIDEAHRAWDEATTTGRCPRCGTFLDTEREQAAVQLAASKHLRMPSLKERVGAVAGGLVVIAGGLLGSKLVLFLAPAAIGVGASAILYGLFYRRMDAARDMLQRDTSLSELARRDGREHQSAEERSE